MLSRTLSLVRFLPTPSRSGSRARALLVLACAPWFSLPASAQTPAPDFHADVAPILRDYCLGCHAGKDAENGLRMETFGQLKKGGDAGNVLAAREGKPPLLSAVLRGEKPAMPPKKEPQPTESEIQTLEAWLAAGAPGPKKADVPLQTLLNIPSLPLPVRESKVYTALAFSVDGQRFARARYKTIEVFETKSGTLLQRFEGLEGKISALRFSSDGKTLAAATGVPGVKGSLMQWNLEGEPKRVDFGGQHRDLIYALQASPDGKWLATGGYDSQILIWDAATRKVVRTLSGHNGAVFGLAFHPDNTLLASASADQTVKIWRLRDGARLDTLKEPQGEQYCVAFSADGARVLAAGADNRVRMWELRSRGKEAINPLLETRYAHEGGITGMVLHPDGTRLLTVSRDRTPKLWSLPDLEMVRVMPLQKDAPFATAYDAVEQEAVVAHADGVIERFPLATAAGSVGSVNEQKQAALATEPAASTGGAFADLRAALAPPAPVAKSAEAEPNNDAAHATKLTLPAEVSGTLSEPGDRDFFSFEARKGEKWIFETNASRSGSSLDSKLEILTSEGAAVERVVLQAMRSSWLTFRGRDSMTTDDFRVQHAHEAELNEYLYSNGEVSKLWAYPSGPDSGFTLYPGFGNRQTYFGTSAYSHALGQTLYLVRPLPAGSQPTPNGLPVFRLNYENDDDPDRFLGKDSYLDFTAPHDGRFVVALSDARGFGGPKFTYRLLARQPKPDFAVKAGDGKAIAINPGSARELPLSVDRSDGFEGEVSAEITGLPPGFHASPSVTVEAGHRRAAFSIWADSDAVCPEKETAKAAKLVGKARIEGREIVHEIALGEITLGARPKLTVQILPEKPEAAPDSGKPLELTIRPGETIQARAVVQRHDFKNQVEFGRNDCCKNLPHGVYVDNVGLNGLLVLEGQNERNFFLTASKWVPPSSRWIFLRCTSDGGHVSLPVLLHVRK